jgi:DNA adenine methylase
LGNHLIEYRHIEKLMPVDSVNFQAKPFLKWAGGKRQLLSQMDLHLPPQLQRGDIVRYAEPFMGSAALFFKIVQTYPIRECLLADANPDLVLVYRTIQQDVEGLIAAAPGI